MPSTTDIYDFADSTIWDFRDVYALYISVHDLSDEFAYETEQLDGDRYLVKPSKANAPNLVLTEKSRRALLLYIQHELMDDMDPENFLAYREMCAANN